MLRKGNFLLFGVLGASMAFAQTIVHQPVNSNGVTAVHTALDHISILSFPEKITRVATGSDTVQVEWHDNTVFIKPLKVGQSTNLMVWTEHQMSTYELEAPGDVKSMSSVIDETATPLPQSQSQNAEAEREAKQRIADSVIGTTLLSASPVISRDIRPVQDIVSVQIKEVVRSGNSLYVRFAVTNTSTHPYRVISPNVFSIVPSKNEQLVGALRNYQIPEKTASQSSLTDRAGSGARYSAAEAGCRARGDGGRCAGARSSGRPIWGVTSSCLAMMAPIEFRLRRCCDARIRNDHGRGGACRPPRCFPEVGGRHVSGNAARPFLNPVEQRDDKGRRKVHTLLVVGLFSRRSPGSA